ncbi:hypothetical protein PDY_11210 [Photobacterium damselae subsp. damselae]|nr:hypothetical protein PDY_11210 [Photobacterium damselae subsp. damselae]
MSNLPTPNILLLIDLICKGYISKNNEDSLLSIKTLDFRLDKEKIIESEIDYALYVLGLS